MIETHHFWKKQNNENARQQKTAPAVLTPNIVRVKINILWMIGLAWVVCSTPLLGQDFIWTDTSAPPLEWKAIASSSDGSLLFATAGGDFGSPDGIYASTNSGSTWTLTSAPADVVWQAIASSSDGSKLVAASGNCSPGGIYTSTNSGLTWTLTSAPNESWGSLASSSDGSRLVTGVGCDGVVGGIYTSTNSGVSWSPTTAPNRSWFSIASSSDGSKLAAAVSYNSSGASGIYTSTNSGQTWTQTSAPNGNWLSIASSSDGIMLAAVVLAGGVYTSTNSGFTWTQTSAPNEDWVSIASSSDGSKLAIVADNASSGGIYTSTNSGFTWAPAPVKSLNWFSIASSSDGTRLAAVVGFGSYGIYAAYIPTNPPSITQQPSTLSSCPGSVTFLGVTTTGTLPFSYQWQKNGTNLMDGGNVIGSTSNNLALLDVSRSDSGNYDVVITNVVGCVTSSVATLFVAPTPATATPEIAYGFIVGAIITDGGCGYTNDAPVFFDGQGGSGAAGYVEISNGSVTNIVITDSGFGYPSDTVLQAPLFLPTMTISLTNSPAAAAIPIITNGFLVGAILTSSGSDYATPPLVTFIDARGHGAAAYAKISNGGVTNIFVTSAGSGYSSNTVINIPPAAYRNVMIPSANSLMLGEPYQLQTANSLNNWTDFGSGFIATNNAWCSPEYWNVTNTNPAFFRLKIVP